MNFKIYLILFSFLENGKLSVGIKFSAESFAEISLLAKKGKFHLESLREKANVPQFGPCWRNAISDLQIGCKFLSENVQSDLALKFTDCFLQMSGHDPMVCDLPKSACLKKLSDRAFNAYTEFYTHTQSICYFLQSQIWHEETEKTINNLSLTSLQVSRKLEEAGEIQEQLLNQQKESLLMQHDLNNSSKNLASILQSSQNKINIFMKDFQITAAEQKELLVDLFDNLISFRSWAINELSWFSSTAYFAAATVIIFLFTSVNRTREARMTIFILFAFNYFLERLLSSSSLTNNFFGNYFSTFSPDSLNSWIWVCRKFCICLGIMILLYTAFSYYDYNLRNYQLLLEIKRQNMEILNHFSVQARNQNNMSKNNANVIDMAYNSFCSNPKSYSSRLNISSESGDNEDTLFKSRFYSDAAKAFDGSNFFYKDVVDSEEKFSSKNHSVSSPESNVIVLNKNSEKQTRTYNLEMHSDGPSIFDGSNFFSKIVDSKESKPLDSVSVTSKSETVSRELKPNYNLRSYKSRKTNIY